MPGLLNYCVLILQVLATFIQSYTIVVSTHKKTNEIDRAISMNRCGLLGDTLFHNVIISSDNANQTCW